LVWGLELKLRQLGSLAVMIVLSASAFAAEQPGTISGYVRDTAGAPQMGAVVEIAGVAAQSLTVFTDGAGFYSVADLVPGLYSIKVSAPSFLPALHEKIGLHSGSTVHLNVTLSTLLDAMRVGPLRGTADDDDWKWTLRSVANRPVLRVFDDPTVVEQPSHEVKASLSFLAGSAAEGYGSGSEMSTGFSIERSMFSADHVGVMGNVGYGDGIPAAALRAVYTHGLPDGSVPSMAVTVRRFAPSDPILHDAALQALALEAGDDFTVGDVVELKFGSELQAVQFLGNMTAFQPFGSLDFHASPNTLVGYQYTTSLPTTEDGVEPASGDQNVDQNDAVPRVSMTNFTPQLERVRHQELNVSRRIGKNSMQVAVYQDHVSNAALVGAGNVSAAGGFALPDPYSGTFTYAGDSFGASGFRVVLERKFSSDLSATLDYACGGVLDLTKPDVELQNAEQWIATERRQAVAAKLKGAIHRTGTHWIASYRWLNGPALTPVDMFNASPARTDPYLNLVIRQQIPTLGFLPSHMEAIIDLRNLLAQGYVPVIAQDGQTVYLVQAARSVRGGVTISF
jgi:hypothetical protein